MLNNILVIGDLMLDVYKSGNVDRISPEAPVPVVKLNKETYVLGGAANVVNNIASLGEHVQVIGIIGNDVYGKKILKLFQDKNVSTENILTGITGTIAKIRVLGNEQQIVRVDCNDYIRYTEDIGKELLKRALNSIKQCDIVILSDYCKGTINTELCKTIITECNKQKKIVIVDPKGKDWDKYKNATIVTPNLKEIGEGFGVNISNNNSTIEKFAKNIYNRSQIENIVLTRSEKGITLITAESIKHFPAQTKEVYDVSGAGDTVVSMLAVELLKTNNIENAIISANIAASIVVAKRGTATITKKEFEEVKNSHYTKFSNKIYSLLDLLTVISVWKKNSEKIVFTNGCFDIFHSGHAYSLARAAEMGDRLIVAINSDLSVKRNKGNSRPISGQEDRAYVIASLGFVDAVIIFEEDTPANILEQIKPDVLVKGGDYQKKK